MIIRTGFQGIRAQYLVAVMLGLLGAAATAAQPLLVGSITEAFTAAPSLIPSFVVLLIAVMAVDALSSTTSGVLLGRGAERFIYNLRLGSADRILQTDVDSLATFDRGDINNRVVEDIPGIPQPWFAVYPQLLSAVTVALLCLAGLLFYSWPLALIVLGILLLGSAVAAFALRRVERHARHAREGESAFSSHLYEILGNIPVLKNSDAATWARQLLNNKAVDTLRAGRALVGWEAVIAPAMSIAFQASLVTVLLYGGSLVARDELELSSLVSFFLYLTFLISPLLTITTSLGDLQQAKVSRHRMEELYAGLPAEEQPNPSTAPQLTTQPSIQTDAAVCRYPGGHPFPLMDLDLQGPGLHVLRGANGVGKSSLFTILAGLRQPVAGHVRVNGMDVAAVSPDRLRQQVCLVPQTRHLFSTTVRDNINLGRAWSDRQIAAAFARLDADDVLASMPQGLDTRIGHEGHSLSGGQEQIVFLVQMLLDDRPILLLDEPLNSLDPRRQARAQKVIGELSGTRLIVLISHDARNDQGPPHSPEPVHVTK